MELSCLLLGQSVIWLEPSARVMVKPSRLSAVRLAIQYHYGSPQLPISLLGVLRSSHPNPSPEGRMRNRSGKIVLLALLLLASCSRDTGLSVNAPDSEAADPDIICESDDNCWCQVFTGAEFKAGRDSGRCKENRCQPCLYD